MKPRRIVLIDVVGLTPKHFAKREKIPHLAALLDKGRLYPLMPVFPALTLPVQASLTSGRYPDEHGVVANGFYFPENHQVAFWEQAAALVQAERIWDGLRTRRPELKTAAIFFQNTLFAHCDSILTPKPLHTEEGMIQWCYSKPVGLYEEICERIGEFNLMSFWGPMASIESTKWIAKASVEVLARSKPDVMLIYFPHLDYCCQKFGPDDPQVEQELEVVDRQVGTVMQGVEGLGLQDETIFVIVSEYAFSSVNKDIPINRLLREQDLVRVRTIKGREYLDIELSEAFAMVDHQIAHIYVKSGREKAVWAALEGIEGIELVMDAGLKRTHRIDHARCGDYIAVSSRDRWFSYYWWEDRAKEPDFATHVDIHRKPGYDPLELFFEPGTFKISQDTRLIKGSHGRPPTSEEDQTVLLISGEIPGSMQIAENPSVTDVRGIIEGLLSSD